MTLLDADKIVDRDPESGRFEELLAFSSPKRILTVSDTTGRGKTTLLQKIRWLCEFRHGLPVALVPLEEYDDHPDEFELVHDIVTQLKQSGVAFPAYETLYAARSFRDVLQFLNSYRSVQGTVQAGGAAVKDGGQVAGVIFNLQSADQLPLLQWTGAADEEAKRLCLDAFFGELAALGSSKTIVLLFDTVDAATDQLRRWIELHLVKRRVLAKTGQDQRLVVVLAGMDIDARLRAIFIDDFDTAFEPIQELGAWDLEDTARLLEVHGYDGLSETLVGSLHESIRSRELSITKALAVAAIYKGDS
jgi:hypothetical protein